MFLYKHIKHNFVFFKATKFFLLNIYQPPKMEKRLNDKVKSYVSTFKDAIRDKVRELSLQTNDQSKLNELLEYVYEYDRLEFNKDDFIKRKRVKNSIPLTNRCNAKRANGEQCTRKRRSDCEFCGTHYKGTPHGLITDEEEAVVEETMCNLEVVAKDICGIVYYVDNCGNVYNTEDVLQNKENPQIVAKYAIVAGRYTIPEFGLV